MPSRSYLLSLPERLLRSTLGLSAGVAREVGEAALPNAVRQGQLYQNLVDTTLRFLIERVGGAEGTYPAGDATPADFMARRAAGNAVEALGIVAFRASPVWVLAALADLSGLGRHLIPEVTDALRAQGLVEPDAQFESVDQLLLGLERTAARTACTINTPPLDVTTLQQEWRAIRDEAAALQPESLPPKETITSLWRSLTDEATRQNVSVFHASSAMTLAAAQRLPEGARWLTSAAAVGTSRVGHALGATLLDHYRDTLDEARRVGFVAYAADQVRPYVNAAVDQFSPSRRSLTEAWLERMGLDEGDTGSNGGAPTPKGQ